VPHIGGAARLLVGSGANPAPSPDGKRIAYSGDDGIWIAPRDSGRAVQIDTGHQANSPAWSPDGRRIAYVRGTMQYAAFGFAPGAIWIVDADGKHRRQVTTGEHLNTSPAWEPDGRAILFVSDRDGTRDIYRQRIDASGEPQDAAERLTTGAEAYNVTVSRDGSRIAYSTVRQGNHIWMAPITDGITPFESAHPVTSEAQKTEGVAISHDGKWIAFDSDRDGPRQHLFKMAFDGHRAVGEPIQLTRGTHDEFSPRWSPDDSEIVFHRIVGGYRDVFVVGSDGRGEQRVTEDTSQYYDPDWSPDARHIVLSSHRAKEKGQRKGFEAMIVSRREDRSWSGRRAVNDAATPAGAVIRWSPKGEQLLMSGLRLLPVEGGAARPIGDPKRGEARGSVVVWGPDARTVYVWDPDSAGIKTIWSVDLSTGDPRPLMRFDDPLRQPFGNRFDTDGKRLFFIMRSDEADVFAAALTRGGGTRAP
jgi:Tol biopolymer transport system component